jgi:hypothetical protein
MCSSEVSIIEYYRIDLFREFQQWSISSKRSSVFSRCPPAQVPNPRTQIRKVRLCEPRDMGLVKTRILCSTWVRIRDIINSRDGAGRKMTVVACPAHTYHTCTGMNSRLCIPVSSIQTGLGCDIVSQNFTKEATMKTQRLLLNLITLLLAPVCVSGSATASGYHERAAELIVGGEACAQHLQSGALDEISFAVHRNGDPESCGIAPSSLQAMFKALAAQQQDCKVPLDKYQVESFLTEFLANELVGGGCGSTDDNDEDAIEGGLLSYCDMGPEKTVIQKDHSQLVRVVSSDSLPCRWFTREGLRISSLEQLAELAENAARVEQECVEEETCAARNTVHLFAVPAGRVFMFAPSFVGETFTLHHLQDATGKTVTLKVLSLSPRVFDIYNFFNQQESTALVEKALGETSETHKFHRSTTGTSGASVFSKRTSENAWDTHGATASIVKR